MTLLEARKLEQACMQSLSTALDTFKAPELRYPAAVGVILTIVGQCCGMEGRPTPKQVAKFIEAYENKQVMPTEL